MRTTFSYNLHYPWRWVYSTSIWQKDSLYALSFKIYVTVFMLFNATAWNAIEYASVTWSQSIRSVARLDRQMYLSALRLDYWDGQMMFIYFRPMPKW